MMLGWLRRQRTGKHAAIDGLRRDVDQVSARLEAVIEAVTIRDAARRARQAATPTPAHLALAAQEARRGGTAVKVDVPVEGRIREVLVALGEQGGDPDELWTSLNDPRFWKRLAS